MLALAFEGVETREEAEKLKQLFSYVSFDPVEAIYRYDQTSILREFVRRHLGKPSLQIPLKFLLLAIRAYILGVTEASPILCAFLYTRCYYVKQC